MPLYPIDGSKKQKKNSAGGITIPYSKGYYRAIVMFDANGTKSDP